MTILGASANDSANASDAGFTSFNLNDAVIYQVRTFCPMFSGNVTGAASPEIFGKIEASNLQTPAAFVLPITTVTDDNEGLTGYQQLETSYVAVVVAFTNSDLRGQAGARLVDSTKRQLLAALANWVPSGSVGEPRGGILESVRVLDEVTGAYVWIEFRFSFASWISQNQVWNASGKSPLAFDITTPFDGSPLANTTNTTTGPASLLDSIIMQVRQAPLFSTNVSGIGSLSVLPDQLTNLPTPSAYACPQDSRTTGNELATGYLSTLLERYAVVVGLNNSADIRGQTALASVYPIKAQLLALLANWVPDPTRMARGLIYDGWDVVKIDRARLWVALFFKAEVQIIQSDVWNPTGVPLKIANIATVAPGPATSTTLNLPGA